MSKNIVGRHLELSDSIKKHISDSIDDLNRYNVEIISTSTNLYLGTLEKKAGRF